MPFPFEGKKRAFFADKGIYVLQEFPDMLIPIPNAKIGKLDPIKLGLIPLLRKSDEIIFHSVKGIYDLR
jgi:cell division protein FtsZ